MALDDRTRMDPGEGEDDVLQEPSHAGSGHVEPDWARLASAAVASSINGMAFADLSGRLTYVNKAFLDLWRYPDGSHVVGRHVWDFWRLPEDARHCMELVKSSGSWTGTLEAHCGDGMVRDLAVSANLVRSETGDALGLVASCVDVSFQRAIERAIKSIQGATSTEIGIGFLQRIAVELGSAVRADFVLIGELPEPRSSRVRASIVVQGDVLADPFEYDLAGTPCETVAGHKTCYYPSGVKDRFADDHMLAELGIEGYAGVPLWDADRKALGLVAVLTRRPIENPEFVASLLEMAAGRIAAEIERSRSEAAVERRDSILTAVGFAAEQFLQTASWQDCIGNVLERLGEAGEVSRVYIFEGHRSGDGGLLVSQTHEWSAPGIAAQLDNPALQNLSLSQSGFSRWEEELVAGRKISGPVTTFPAAERDLLEAQGIRSLLVVPIIAGSSWWGFIGFDDCSANREWSLAQTESLQAAARILGAAIHRQEAEGLRRRLEAAIEQSSDGVAITDGARRVYYANSAFERLSRLERASLLGSDLSSFSDESGDGLLSPEFARAMSEEEGWRGRILRREGSRASAFDVAISPVRNKMGSIASRVAICRDVSREVQLEQQVRQSQKMETVGRLASGIAHDFNNLLCAVLGYADLIKEKLSPEHPAYQDAQEIIENSTRASAVARQLLVFSRRPRMTRKPVDLNTLVSEMSKLARRLIGEQIMLTTSLAADLPTVLGDSTQLEQVLMNLIVNARDSMPGGGVLSIRTGSVMAIRVDGSPEEPHVVLTVEDTGCGMSEEVRGHLFEPFFTTKEPGKGTGLGLATCFAIVSQHGGFIEADSRPGTGSVFRVVLPASSRAIAPSSPRTKREETVRPRGWRLLVVEDEEPIRRLVTRALTERGYSVLEAESGDAALQLERSDLEKLDAVVTDVVLPGLDGVTLVRRLQEIRPQIRCLFVSGHASDVLARHGLGYESVSLVHKPFAPRDLVQRLEQLLASPEGDPAARALSGGPRG